MGISGSDVAPTRARFGAMRFGAFRFGDIQPHLIVKINGAVVTSRVLRDRLRITDAINDQPNRCSMVLRGDGLSLEAGHSVTVALGLDQPGTSRIFVGSIVRVRRIQGRAAAEVRYEVAAVDYNWLLDRQFVTARWTNVSATVIVRELIAGYTTDFTTDHVAGGLATIDEFTCTNVRPSTALTRLAKLVGGQWFVDEQQDLHFFLDNSTALPNPPDLTSSYTGFWDLDVEHDLSQIRTRVIVEGRRTGCLIGTPSDADIVTGGGSSGLVDYLIVAGGGAGGGSRGGGGGGGGVLSGSTAVTVGAYAVTIGAGGVYGVSDGGASTLFGLTATGGGNGQDPNNAGNPGGSGGGGSGFGYAGGAGTSGQGYQGGTGSEDTSIRATGGGGGGGGGVGGNAGNAGGNGGTGRLSSISGTATYYAAGGGGKGDNGAGSPTGAGAANTGNGGGGGSYSGGSGVAIVRYVTDALTATGGTITTAGGYTIHTFTSAGTFTVTAVGEPAVSGITDLPIEDPSALNTGGGTVRIGTQILDYSGTSGAVVTTGDNPPGSTLTADAAAGATSVSVDSVTPFTESDGWVKIADQIVRYSAKGASTLTLPASGFGSLAGSVASGSAVTYLGRIDFTTGITLSPPIAAGESIIERVTIDDAGAQANLAAIEGGDGIHEMLVQDGRLGYEACAERALAELAAFNAAITTIRYKTRDTRTSSGRTVQVSVGGVDDAFVIQEVVYTGFDELAPVGSHHRTAWPVREVTAVPLRMSSLTDVIGSGEDAS